MPDPAPAAFRELVLSRSASLHRTAVLLGRDEADARELLEEALARASRTWDRSEGQPEGYCRSVLARVASSPGRRRRHTGTARKAPPSSPAEALHSLPPRQRAVVVLRHYHDYTPEQTAEALNMRARAVHTEEDSALTALGWSDVCSTMDAIADSAAPPDAAALLAASQRRTQQIGRRRRTVWAAAGVAVLTVAGAGALLGGSDDTTEDVTKDVTQNDLAVPDASYAVPDVSYTQGYGLADGVARPYTIDGLRLLVSREISPGSQWSTGLSPTEADSQLYAVAWCTGEAATSQDQAPVTLSSRDQRVVSLPCTTPTDRQSVAVEPLPVNDALWRFDNLMQNASAVVAVYEEAAWEDFPFEPPGHQMAWSPPQPSAGSVVIDSTSPMRPRPDLEAAAGTTSTYSVTVPMTVTTQADLDVILDGPGQLLVALDGRVVTDDGDRLAAPFGLRGGLKNSAEPDLREGFVHNFEPGVRPRTFSVDSDSLGDLGVDLSDGEVVVSVVPRAVRPTDWAVEITTSDFTPAAQTVLEPVLDDTLPLHAFGLRQVGAVDVPADGRERPVGIDPTASSELVWVTDCRSLSQDQFAQVSVDRTPANAVGSCLARDPWASVLRWPGGGGGAGEGDADSAQPQPAARPQIAATVDGQESVRVTAYEPVPWQDYPFASSTVAPDDPAVPVPGQAATPGNDGSLGVFVESDVVTLDDLDPDGRAVLRLEPARYTELVIQTTGVGRFRLEVTPTGSEPVAVGLPGDLGQTTYGEVLERDGWWSSWTAAPSSWLVPALSRKDGRPVQELGGEVTVTVEGYVDGTLEIAAISLPTASDD